VVGGSHGESFVKFVIITLSLQQRDQSKVVVAFSISIFVLGQNEH